MGIVKIVPQVLGGKVPSSRGSSSTLALNELAHEEKLLLPTAPIGIFSDDHLEVGSECVTVGGQTCYIPYELYRLPDLTKILNIETWNNCLTEEERFSLSAFLPGMDQETFWLTIKELLTGEIMFFGSPLGKFFTGLRGGFYHMEVAHLRENLQFFQKREYYHFLLSYHNNMIQKFMDMKTVWNKSHSGTSIEERMHVLNNRKRHKPVLLVDLNAYPEDDAINKNDKSTEMVSYSKKSKNLIARQEPDVTLSSAIWKSKAKPKGVLKIKPVETTRSIEKCVVHPSVAEPTEPPKRLPKGVLKIKPKLVPTEFPMDINTLQKVSADLPGIHAPGTSSKFAFQCDDRVVPEKLPYKHQIERDNSANPNLEHARDQQTEEFLTKGPVSLHSSQNRETEPKFKKGVRPQDAMGLCKNDTFPIEVNRNSTTYSHEAGQTGNWHGGKALWKHSKAKPEGLTYMSSKAPRFESFQDGPRSYKEMQANETNSDISLRMLSSSSSTSNKHRVSRDYPNDLDHRFGDQTDGHIPSGQNDDSGGNKDLLPITYKRKRPFGKPKHVEPIKQKPSVVNEEAANLSNTLSVKPKSIKIKFKGLTGYKV